MIGTRLLDRYVLGLWVRIFLLTGVGFPLLSILINLTDNLNRLLDKGLPFGRIALGYAYSIPEFMFLVLPAAVLFATVFTINTLGRHSELTAAKAGGWSFYRLGAPLLLAAVAAAGLTLLVGELAPRATAEQLRLHDKKPPASTQRYGFVYRGDAGWVYAIGSLDAEQRVMRRLLLEREGRGADYPSLVVTADSARWDTTSGTWTLHRGTSRLVPAAAAGEETAYHFGTLRLRTLRESPKELLAEAKAPEEMDYTELGAYIDALKRSGSDTAKLEVEQALKLALPATCIVVALFGAPLAMTSHRAGTAVGIGISLGTTVVFLLLAQIARAVGQGGVIDPVAAAWAPNALFLAAAIVLLGRVRT